MKNKIKPAKRLPVIPHREVPRQPAIRVQFNHDDETELVKAVRANYRTKPGKGHKERINVSLELSRKVFLMIAELALNAGMTLDRVVQYTLETGDDICNAYNDLT